MPPSPDPLQRREHFKLLKALLPRLNIGGDTYLVLNSVKLTVQIFTYTSPARSKLIVRESFAWEMEMVRIFYMIRI